ncbi:MAG: CoA pyrophosphatase [Rhodobacteraceae bacterium]|nr:CoA pyrophosphatase [Paracoccaceae bacterium]
MVDLTESLRLSLVGPGPESSDFDLNPGVILPKDRKLRPAGVLIAVSLASEEPMVILTKRASGLKHHPGQIAFAGGKQDKADQDVIAAALREAREEIGLPDGMARVVGTLPVHETITGFRVTPVVAIIEHDFDVVAEPGEVDDVFQVPLAHVLDRDAYLIESRIWRGKRRYYFVVPYGPYYIWGATARMLRGLAERMGQI